MASDNKWATTLAVSAAGALIGAAVAFAISARKEHKELEAFTAKLEAKTAAAIRNVTSSTLGKAEKTFPPVATPKKQVCAVAG